LLFREIVVDGEAGIELSSIGVKQRLLICVHRGA
jgi:hypothetical protein